MTEREAFREERDAAAEQDKALEQEQQKEGFKKQVEIYKKASDADKGLKVITYFTKRQYERVMAILDDLGIRGEPNIILIDARSDNKPSASKA